jgi:hypothetical protein
MHRIRVQVLVLAVVLLGGLAIGRAVLGTAAQEDTTPAEAELVGSWAVTVQIDGGPAFVNFATVAPGGVLTNTAPGSATGHGAWERAGDGSYAVIFVHPTYGADGAFQGQATVRATVVVDPGGDAFAGPFVNEVTNAAGNVMASFSGTVSARRIAVEPLGSPTVATPAS